MSGMRSRRQQPCTEPFPAPPKTSAVPYFATKQKTRALLIALSLPFLMLPSYTAGQQRSLHQRANKGKEQGSATHKFPISAVQFAPPRSLSPHILQQCKRNSICTPLRSQVKPPPPQPHATAATRPTNTTQPARDTAHLTVPVHTRGGRSRTHAPTHPHTPASAGHCHSPHGSPCTQSRPAPPTLPCPSPGQTQSPHPNLPRDLTGCRQGCRCRCRPPGRHSLPRRSPPPASPGRRGRSRQPPV